MRRVCSLGLLGMLAVLGCSSKRPPETVWIGQILPLEGANRTLAQHARQGVELAVAEARGADRTFAGHPCAVLHVDSGGDADEVQAQTVRLLTVDRALALISDFDAVLTERMIRASRSYNVPAIVPGELPGPTDSGAVVSLGVPPAVRGRMLARYASATLKLPRAAVLTDSRNPIAASVAAAFVKTWPPGNAIQEWTFTTAAERDDCRKRLIEAKPAVVVLACSVADFHVLRPLLASALPNVPLLHGGEDAGAAALKAELEKQPDVYLATAYSNEHLSDCGRAFVRGYEERFHESPDLYAAQSYDAARLLFEAMQGAADASREALGKELARQQDFESVTGRMSWKDRQPRRRVFLTRLQNNRAKIVSILEPEEN